MADETTDDATDAAADETADATVDEPADATVDEPADAAADEPADAAADDQAAAAAFGLLSDATRVGILRAVEQAQRERGVTNAGPVALSFSDIYDRVDVDNTSKLSYHLGELVGTFLRKTEDGYSFTHAGEQMVRFVLARNYGDLPEFEPRETEGICPFCEERSLEARFHYQFFYVGCTACDKPVAGHPVTPSQIRSWSEDELVRNAAKKQALDYTQIRRGICPQCSGRLSTTVRRLPEQPLSDADPFFVHDQCEQCLREYSGPLTYGAAYHPASVAFHRDRGLDVATAGLWEFHEHLVEGRWSAEKVSADPDEYEVVLRRDGDALRCRLDGDATVTRTERVRRG